MAGPLEKRPTSPPEKATYIRSVQATTWCVEEWLECFGLCLAHCASLKSGQLAKVTLYREAYRRFNDLLHIADDEPKGKCHLKFVRQRLLNAVVLLSAGQAAQRPLSKSMSNFYRSQLSIVKASLDAKALAKDRLIEQVGVAEHLKVADHQ